MSFWDDVGDALEFEWYHAKELWSDIKDDPERLFIGAIDPISTDMWNQVLGKDYEPMVNQWGGATNERFVGAAEEGMNVEPAMFMHDTAKSIAQSYAMSYGAGAAGDYAGSQGASPEVQAGIEKGFSAIGEGLMNPPEPAEDDPDFGPGEDPAKSSKKKKQQALPTFGLPEATKQAPPDPDVPGAVRVVHDPYGQAVPPDPYVVPTFGRA